MRQRTVAKMPIGEPRRREWRLVVIFEEPEVDGSMVVHVEPNERAISTAASFIVDADHDQEYFERTLGQAVLHMANVLSGADHRRREKEHS